MWSKKKQRRAFGVQICTSYWLHYQLHGDSTAIFLKSKKQKEEGKGTKDKSYFDTKFEKKDNINTPTFIIIVIILSIRPKY